MNRIQRPVLAKWFYQWLFLVIFILSIIAGCAREHKLKPIQFKPHPPSKIPEAELPPIPTTSPVQSLRTAGAYFDEAKEALKKGDKKTAQEKYLTARRTLISAGIVPGIFQELNEFWEREMLSDSERKINLESLNTYKIIEGLKATPPYSSIKFPFPVPERVLYEIEDAQTRYPDRFQEGLDRSGYYVPHLRNALKQAGLPQELCWVAMVESMYKLKAYSSAGAAGMWQFIRSTGLHYNLRIDSYVDERYNWVVATSSAINYMKNLHNFFNGSWELAISAYNMGEGGLLRAIEANGGDRNFWTLTETPPASYRIKEETKKYYPRFLAYILVCNDPTPYGFSPSPHSPIQWDEIEVDGMYALSTLDDAMGYQSGTLATWNPHLIRETTPPQGCKLMLPMGDGQKLAKLLTNQSLKGTEFISYRVKKGESAYQIARRHGISVDELLKINGFTSMKSVKMGVILQVPSANYKNTNFARHDEKKAENKDIEYHIVQPGETLYSIAKKYNRDIEDLISCNSFQKDKRLKVGEKINLVPMNPSKSTAVDSTIVNDKKNEELSSQGRFDERNVYHTVSKGDTISSIAKKYSVKPENIMKYNNLTHKSILRIGQKLIISKEVVEENTTSEFVPLAEKTEEDKKVEEKSENKIYVVQQGDTLSKIAKENNVSLKSIMELNNLSSDVSLKIGQKILLSGDNSGRRKNIQETATNNDNSNDKSNRILDERPAKIIEHTVQAGESLWSISKKYNVKIEKIEENNPQINKEALKVGTKLLIPVDSVSPEILAMKEPVTPESEKEEVTDKKEIKSIDVLEKGSITYKVQPGDNLWIIARRSNVSVSDLVKWNSLDTTSKLKPGQELKIHAQTSSMNTEILPANEQNEKKVSHNSSNTSGVITKPNTYIVQKGDSLYSISKKTGVPLKQLMELNKISDKKVLKIGEEIILGN